MLRTFWLNLHRYSGLGMAVFLVIVGLTGSVLAYHDVLDEWLNPDRDLVETKSLPLLDALTLRDRALALAPGMLANNFDLQVQPNKAYSIQLTPPGEPVIANGMPVGYVALKLDPYTGQEISRSDAILGMRAQKFWPLDRENVLDFLHMLHVQLVLGQTGDLILGIVALVWVIDCFVAAYLTFPVSRSHSRRSDDKPLRRRWLARWWNPAWLVKRKTSNFRLNFDLHRAGGLWTWPALLMFAWTSGTFNLHSVFHPLNDLFFGKQPQFQSAHQAKAQWEPPLEMRSALAVGRRLMAEQARLHDFQVLDEYSFSYNPQTHYYFLAVNGDPLFGGQDGTFIRFDAVNAKVLELHMPSGLDSAVTAREWMSGLHTAAIWGWPYRAFVCVMGLVITLLSVTGVYIWWKKRKARNARFAPADVA